MDNDSNSCEGEILLGLWDCSSCQTKGVRGDVYQCSVCGAPRPDDVEFYLPENAEVLRGCQVVDFGVSRKE